MSQIPPSQGDSPSPLPGALTPAHLEQLAAARRLSAKLRTAAVVAGIDGWSMVVFAVLTLLCGFTSLGGLVMGLGIGVVAALELRAAAALKRLDQQAPRRLAMNQIALAVLLFGYGAISLWQTLHSAHPLSGVGELVGDLGPYEAVIRSIMAATYAAVMAAAVIGPGLMALYYRSRARILQTYLAQTPQWILDLQRSGMSL